MGYDCEFHFQWRPFGRLCLKIRDYKDSDELLKCVAFFLWPRQFSDICICARSSSSSTHPRLVFIGQNGTARSITPGAGLWANPHKRTPKQPAINSSLVINCFKLTHVTLSPPIGIAQLSEVFMSNNLLTLESPRGFKHRKQIRNDTVT